MVNHPNLIRIWHWSVAIGAMACLGYVGVLGNVGASELNGSRLGNNRLSTVSSRLLLCPFCSTVNRTFTEQLSSNEVAVVAKLVELPPPPKEDEDGYLEFSKGKFEIVGILKGEKIVNEGMNFRTQLIGTYKVGEKFLVMGVNPPRIAWTTPMRTNDRVFRYLQDIQTLPPKGPERLVFFQNYFEDKESILAFDAYDEYALAPYEDLIAMKDKMDRPRLVAFVKNPKTTVLRRRLYLTMLGVCGTEKEAKLLEEYIKSGDRKKQAGLDALLACYLRLKGAAGLPLVEETFLKDKSVDYVDVVSAVMALRFHATECDVIPQKRIVESVKLLLDRPKVADMVITDLARWEDWTVVDRLVDMFKESDTETAWVRVPIITYLRACPDPKAAEYIEELRKIDAEAVERADFYIGFGEDEGDSWDDDDDTAEESKPDESKTDESPKPDSKPGGDGSSNSEPDKVDQDLVKLAVEMPIEKQRVTLAQGDPIVIQPEPSNINTVAGETPSEDSATFEVSAPATPQDAEAVALSNRNGTANSSIAPSTKSTPTAGPQNESPTTSYRFQILLYPFLGSMVILGVMWSVFNGWFERLIY